MRVGDLDDPAKLIDVRTDCSHTACSARANTYANGESGWEHDRTQLSDSVLYCRIRGSRGRRSGRKTTKG
jgi:hypothetical protein